jgi:uncharacterized protein (DUF302 family)
MASSMDYSENKGLTPEGVIIRPSPWSVKETIDRLVVFLQGHGATVYARINQQSEVENAGHELSPLEFILFGNPAVGGRLMAENPVAALDLPLKIIAWEGADGKVSLAYNKAAYIGDRYALPAALSAPLDLDPLVTKALA